MGNFRTTYKAKQGASLLDYNSSSFFIGSCFSNNISAHLAYRKFKVCANPYGILFNPISIARALKEIVDERIYVEEDLVQHNGIYHSLHHHSDYSNPDAAVVLSGIQESISVSKLALEGANMLFVTLGTAWAYEYEGAVVANCHKIPNHRFKKRLLTVNEIKTALRSALEAVATKNNNLSVVFTVSPVRHLKDGFEENSLSKAVLRLAIAELQNELANVTYFPAYEIVQDDLRDYRFYAKDMVHPSEDAITYVWDRFKETYIDPKVQNTMSRIEKLQAAIDHRPRFPDTEAYQKHLAFIEKEQELLKEFLP